MLELINPGLWFIANLLVGYITIVVMSFTLAYYFMFDPNATTGGKLIFRFFVSLDGLVLLASVRVFLDPIPDRNWWEIPEHIDVFRPLVLCVIYGYVAFTITSLSVFLVIRKLAPHKVRKANDQPLLKVRSDTSEITTIDD